MANDGNIKRKNMKVGNRVQYTPTLEGGIIEEVTPSIVSVKWDTGELETYLKKHTEYIIVSREKKTNNHYSGEVQPIDLIEAQGLNFSRGNAVKYICRAGRKENELEDLEKALWYIQREIDNINKEP